MSIGIGNNYSSYYAQVSNNSISNTDKTTVNNASTTDETTKTTSKDEYFKNLCDKYCNANLNMSNSHLNKENEITFNVSPQLVNKAMNDPETAENLNRLLDQMSSVPQYINAHKYTGDGREVKNVSFVIDENGGVSCKCEYVQKDSKNTSEKSDEEKLLEKKIEERKEKAKALTEAQEKDLKVTKERKVSNYTNNIAKIIDINFLDTNA